MQSGYENVFPINIGGTAELDGMKATMVQAKHTSSYGETEGTPIYAGEAAGYILNFDQDHTVYHSGDTALMYDMKLIQDMYTPTIAILAASGQFTMGPKEAAYAVENLLDVEYVIPNHAFPTQEQAASRKTLDQLVEAFPVVQLMMGKDEEFKNALKEDCSTKVMILGYGEEIDISI